MVNLRPMAPLPRGYSWQVDLDASQDTLFLFLLKRGLAKQCKSHFNRRAFSTPITVIVDTLISDSYQIKQDYFGMADNNEWAKKAEELRRALGVKVVVSKR